MKQKRIRDFGIEIGHFPCGAHNKITDVPGVTVGQVTLRKGEIQTGVTVVMPAQDNLFTCKMTAACHVWIWKNDRAFTDTGIGMPGNADCLDEHIKCGIGQ